MTQNLNNYLQELAAVRAELDRLGAEYEKEVRPITDKYEKLAKPSHERADRLEKLIKDECKQHHHELFGDGEDVRLDLKNGSVFYKAWWQVKRARKLLETLKARNLLSYLKVSYSVDWEKIEELPDAKLIDLGTDRQKKTKYEFEVKTDAVEAS